MEHQEEKRICQNCKTDFTIEPDDFSFYEKIKVPPPTFCPECRAQRRFVCRNERKLFKVKDDFTGKDIFSLYPPESGRKVISQEAWHGDSWDAQSFGMEYDFSKSFFEQFLALRKKVPTYNLNVQMMVGSPYCGNATGLKNCYLIFNSNYSENCMYGNAVDHCKDCIDNSHTNHSERCYDTFWLQNCYKCYFTIMSVESQNLWFSRDCLSCNDCFGCTNLRKSSYCIFNKQYTKEEYHEEIKKMRLDTYSGLMEGREKARTFWKTQPNKYHQGLKNFNCTGSYVGYSKNVKDSYLVRESENLRYCQYMQVPGNKDCYDACFWGEHMELLYESSVCGENSYNLKFCVNCWPSCRDSEYSLELFSSSNCFGCVGLKKKEYCILNKQYIKEAYFDLVEKIKKHMDEMPYIDSQGLVYKYGELFPIEFTPFGYNNTVAIQHFPLSKNEAEAKGYPWIEVEKGEYSITMEATEIPDAINDVSDSIIKEVIECESCKRAYRILENEFTFLKAEKIPVPRLCNDCRHERRIGDRLKLFLYERSCMCNGAYDENNIYKNTVIHSHGEDKCQEVFKTGYAPDQPEIVYCEKCYQQEVY